MRVGRHGGAALIMDYGRDAPYGDSLMAIRGHQGVEVSWGGGYGEMQSIGSRHWDSLMASRTTRACRCGGVAGVDVVITSVRGCACVALCRCRLVC